MIRYKSSIFCSIISRVMFNLNEFQYSNAVKSIRISRSKTNLQNKQLIHKQIEVFQGKSETVNIPIKIEKKKNKKLIPDPIKTYEKISQWRKTHVAPVDTMGCDRLSQPTQSQQIQKYQTLIALMLSIQTTDQITSMIVKRLQQHGLTPKNIAQTPENKLIELIYQSNFNKRKAKNLIQVSKQILQNGLPKSKQDLIKLPGIGIKIAMIYLRAAQGILEGIGVDTHVHRISNTLGWVNTSNPNQTQEQLQKIFPKEHWQNLNIDLVGFGQILCNAKKPLCQQCPVSNLCPSSTYVNVNNIKSNSNINSNENKDKNNNLEW